MDNTHAIRCSCRIYSHVGLERGYDGRNRWDILPDLDEPKSKFGKMFPFVSIPLNRLFGHRTLTHSLFFATIVGLSLWPIIGQPYALAGAIGILAHVAGDMLTGRVQVLYPISKVDWYFRVTTRFLLMDRMVRLGILLWILIVAGQNIVI